MPLAAALQLASQAAQPTPLRIMPWEEATGPSLKTILAGFKPQAVAVFIGPEGGFTATEATMARETSAHLVKLGPRILRAETAGLAVSAAILYELDEWD
jgi:16S rRNA (uracil1498-N3)-methyltransferase